jgi:ribosome-binding factor A
LSSKTKVFKSKRESFFKKLISSSFNPILFKSIVEHDLNNAAGFFRSLLAERLEVRHTPELRFIFDESIEYGAKIEKIIEQLHEEE